MPKNSKVSGIKPSKITRNFVQQPRLFQCPSQQYICANLDFALYHICKTSIGTIWTPRMNIVCQKRHERIISEKQQQKSLFLMSSKVWKL